MQAVRIETERVQVGTTTMIDVIPFVDDEPMRALRVANLDQARRIIPLLEACYGKANCGIYIDDEPMRAPEDRYADTGGQLLTEELALAWGLSFDTTCSD